MEEKQEQTAALQEQLQGLLQDGKLDDTLFSLLTQYNHNTNNVRDNCRRSELLGMGGRKIQTAPGAQVRVKDKNKIGSNIFIGLFSYINGDVEIGDNVLIGPHCCLVAGNHKFDPATGYFSARTEKDGDDSIKIGFGCWLASNVTVTAGVKLGRANLVCAGAVVTKSTPDYAIMAGIPARQVGRIDPVTGAYLWNK